MKGKTRRQLALRLLREAVEQINTADLAAKQTENLTTQEQLELCDDMTRQRNWLLDLLQGKRTPLGDMLRKQT